MKLTNKLMFIACVIGAGFMTCGIENAQAQQLDTEQYALIYNGPIADADSTEAIVDVVKQVGLPVRYLSKIQDLPTMLINAKVFIVGGTQDDVAPLLNEFTKAESTALKAYLDNGGRYLGICGGAFIASTGWSEDEGFVQALGIVPAMSDDYDGDFAARIFPITWLGEARRMYYQAGPEFMPVQSPESVKIVAYFQDSNIAALISSYGKGKVAVSGPHPEAPESWKDNAQDGERMESNIHLAVALLQELLSGQPVLDSQ